jgi:hypothetical protein
MPSLVSNLIEKRYTPYTAKLAPEHLWARPSIGRQPQKVTSFGADPTVKSTFRFIRRWVCHNHKVYYTLICVNALLVYNLWFNAFIGYYQKRNVSRSLPFAIQREQTWELNKPKEEDEYDEEEEE